MFKTLQKGDEIWVNPKVLRPTQAVLGYCELSYKINLIKKMTEQKFKIYTKNKKTPAVVGPKGELYIIDHHHHAYSLIKAKKNRILIEIKANYSSLKVKEFWNELKKRNWVYLRDENGEDITANKIPKTLKKLKNDPYRGLAWVIRKKEGFRKMDHIPYFEFSWAKYYRKYIPKEIVQKHFNLAIEMAYALSKISLAKNLPGYFK